MSRQWADHTATRFPTHSGLTDPDRGRALELLPTPGGWLDLGYAQPTDVTASSDEPVLDVSFARLVDYLTTHTPPGTPGAEAGLARVCAVLSGWEDAYRALTLPAGLLALHQRGDYTIEDLRSLTGQDLVALVELASTGGALVALRRLAEEPPPGLPLGTAAPVFVHH